jgi:hypothetical protein
MKEYRVRAVKDMDGNMETVEYDDQADMFGVYKVQPDGTDSWIADFLHRADAEMFAIEKEKENV